MRQTIAFSLPNQWKQQQHQEIVKKTQMLWIDVPLTLVITYLTNSKEKWRFSVAPQYPQKSSLKNDDHMNFIAAIILLIDELLQCIILNDNFLIPNKCKLIFNVT